MKKKRLSVEQITAVLQQAEQCVPAADLCRKVGISEQRVYPLEEGLRRLAAQRGPGVEATPRREGQVEAAARRPVARQGDAPAYRSKKVLKPVKQREVVHYTCVGLSCAAASDDRLFRQFHCPASNASYVSLAAT